jgi:hypothetical protein
METPFIKIRDTFINMDNVAVIKEEGGNLNIDFAEMV